jgi:spoIIIJ-associated protein
VEWVETVAKTVEEAKEHLLDSLGVDERDAEFEVLEEPRTGIFGRAKGDARVRARVRPASPRQKTERPGRRRERADRPASSAAAPSRPESADRVERPTSERGSTTAKRDGLTTQRERPAPSGFGEDGPGHALPDLDLGQQAAIVAEVLEGVLQALGTAATVDTRVIDADTAEVAVTGEGLGYLVGPRGRTLTALNEVVRSVVLRRGNTPQSTRVHVDVSGYRQRRRDALTAFSLSTADQVIATGLPHALEPMGAADRKVVHDAVTDVVGVTSTSEGEDHQRRVVILPA